VDEHSLRDAIERMGGTYSEFANLSKGTATESVDESEDINGKGVLDETGELLRRYDSIPDENPDQLLVFQPTKKERTIPCWNCARENVLKPSGFSGGYYQAQCECGRFSFSHPKDVE